MFRSWDGTWDQFVRLFRNGDAPAAFFAWLDVDIESGERERKIDWLRFLKTEAIWDGFRSRGRESGGIDVNRCEGDTAVLALLLERFILNLAHRRNPTALGEFLRRVLGDGWPELHSLWDEAGLPDTIDNDRRVPEQEARFAEVLDRCAGRIEGGDRGWLSRWAIPVLERVAAGRRPGEADRALGGWCSGCRMACRRPSGPAC